MRDFEGVVEFAQREVRSGHVADQRSDYGLAVFLGAQEVRAGRFGGAPQPAPNIDFKRQQLHRGRSEIAILRRKKRGRQRRSAIPGETIDLHVAAGDEIWKLIGAGDPQVGAGLFDTRDGIAQIVIALQCRTNQLLEFFVLEDDEPFEVGNGSGLSRRQGRRRAKRRGDAGDGTFVIRADGATDRESGSEDQNDSPAHGQSPSPGRGCGGRTGAGRGAVAPEIFSTR